MSDNDARIQFDNEALRAIAAALDVKTPTDNGGIPFAVVPDGYVLHNLRDLLPIKPKPQNLKQKVQINDVQSFIAYVNDFKVDDSRLFGQRASTGYGGTIQAFLDYHSPRVDGQNHCEHVVTFTPALSEQWKRWSGIHNKAQSQSDLAYFLEENLLDVAEPSGATLKEIAESLEAKKTGDFKQAVRLDNGAVRFMYNETIEARAGQKGDMDIPSKIKLGIPIFENGPLYAVEANFRYRLDGGKLIFIVSLHRAEFIHDDAWKEIGTLIGEQTGKAIFNGFIS